MLFSGCRQLLSVILGNSIKSLGKETFYGCYNLKHITLPNNITSLGDFCFTFCSNLECTLPLFNK